MTTEIRCLRCNAPMVAGPRGGLSQNYYCTDRKVCRAGCNITVWQGDTVMRESIGEIDDERYAKYAPRVQ